MKHQRGAGCRDGFDLIWERSRGRLNGSINYIVIRQNTAVWQFRDGVNRTGSPASWVSRPLFHDICGASNFPPYELQESQRSQIDEKRKN